MRVGDNYTTLSYCAGDPHKTAIILVDGIPFNAFANLEHAIDRLWAHWTSTHPREEPLLLWADQISINQSDKDERSQQVQIMRDIYRRSSETYVCLSVPTIKDCLSWTPGILACSNLKDAMPSRREADQGVKLLQHLLLELLRGRNKGAKSRAIASEPTAVVDLVPNDEESLGGVSITTFQTSLASFITNSWWRRSWVYQEFLSANSIYFISGSITLRWHDLSPLVEFVCNGLEQFTEDVRKHFESQVTEEMESKHREELEIERSLWREERERQLRKKQQRLREEQERKRTSEEAKRHKQYEEQQKRRKAEEHMAAQIRFQEREERYRQEQRRYDEESLSQWNAACEQQRHQRKEFEKEQRDDVFQERIRLSYQMESITKVLHPMKVVRLHRRLKKLGRFRLEVMKPIDDQIQIVKQAAAIGRSAKAEKKLNQRCGWRLHAPERVHALHTLDKVPEMSNDFVPSTITPPMKPKLSLSLLTPHLIQGENSTDSQSSRIYHASNAREVRSADRQLGSRTAAIRAWDRYTTPVPPSNPEANVEDARLSPISLHDASEIIEEEALPDRRDISRVRLGGQEIERRDKITRLQDEFRRLDRSALASIVKGKKDFRRHSDLMALLQHSRNCLASDSRDRIYAFIGLAEPGYNIIPNYEGTNKLEHVLIQTAKSIIRRDKSLRVLEHVHRGRANLGVRLPSWVPDWTSKETMYGIDNHEWDKATPFNAGKDTNALHQFQSHAEDDLYEYLNVKGVVVGEIERIEEPKFDHVSSLILSGGAWVFGPRAAREGDEVWVMYGARRPAVLRNEGVDRYSYLGDAVICEDTEYTGHDAFSAIMYGQLVEDVNSGKATASEVWLV
ncbi:hypothetical protein J4E91_005139 [Alternaria rosae]|nr:hypothetical protein J4E91_005139 [Alternaria rosae]